MHVILENVTEDILNNFASRIGQYAGGKEIFLLKGDLGAGKTVFAKALAKGFGVEEHVTSPTFTLINIYQSRKGAFVHADLYRIDDADEITYLGIEEYFDEALLVIEWPERLKDIPPHFMEIEITVTDPLSRKISFTACGEKEELLLEELKHFADTRP